jgi:hypothetical protein
MGASMLVQAADMYASKVFGETKSESSALIILLAAKGLLASLNLKGEEVTAALDLAIEMETIAGIGITLRDSLTSSILNILQPSLQQP